MHSGGTKFQCDSSPENHLSGFFAPQEGSHPVIQNSRVGVGRHCGPEPGGGGQEGPGWQEMAVGTGLQSRPGPGPAEGIPCPRHDSLPRPPAWPGRAPAPHQTTSPRWCYTLTPRGLRRPPLLRTSRNVCSQLLMPRQLHLGTVPCSAPPPHMSPNTTSTVILHSLFSW